MSENYVICGFSGVGKSTAHTRHKNVEDWESSIFSHVFDGNMLPVGEKNPAFPNNYINALCKALEEKHDTYFLLSCHQVVRDELKNRGIPYVIVMPKAEHKNEYLKRWLKRGSSIEFIELMYEKWEEMIESCIKDDAPKIILEEHEYIDDILPR